MNEHPTLDAPKCVPEREPREVPSHGPDRLRVLAAEVGKKRGVKAGSIRGPYRRVEAGAPSPVVAPPLALFNEQNTARLFGTPFKIVAIRTNCAGWLLEPDEEKELAVTGSVFFNEWVSIHPKWVSLALFSLSLCSITISKVIQWEAYKAALAFERERLKSQSTEKSDPPIPDGSTPPIFKVVKEPDKR